MKYIIILSSLFLTGCIATPVKHTFPTPPPVIVERCPELFPVAENEDRLSEFLKTISKNYTLYHDCAAKHDLLVKWLKEQTQIHDSVFNKGK